MGLDLGQPAACVCRQGALIARGGVERPIERFVETAEPDKQIGGVGSERQRAFVGARRKLRLAQGRERFGDRRPRFGVRSIER